MKNMSNKEIISTILDIPDESQSIEFKRLGAKGEIGRALESIVAMANTDGGVLVIGVNDPEETKIQGVDRIFGIEESIENFDHLGREIQKISPPIGLIWPPKKIFVDEVEKHIALLFIPKSSEAFRPSR